MISCINIGVIAAAVKTAIGDTDPYWSSVVCLLHGNTLTDSSSFSLAFTNTGVTVNTSYFKYGTGSLYCGASYRIYSGEVANINLYSVDYTIESFVRITNYTSTRQIIHLKSSSNIAATGLYVSTTGNVRFTHTNSSTGTQTITSTTALTTNTWYHVAGVVSSGVMYLFVNGTLEAQATLTKFIDSTGLIVSVGGSATGTNYFYGYIDELRITKGVARYTSNFTPPTQAFPNQ